MSKEDTRKIERIEKALREIEEFATTEKHRDLAIRFLVPFAISIVSLAFGFMVKESVLESVPAFAQLLGILLVWAVTLLMIYLAWMKAKYFRDSREVFSAITNAYVNQTNSQLEAFKVQLEASQRVAAALTAKYEPLLVSWDTSGRLEKEALTVRCLTPNLAWLAATEHFDELVSDVAKNTEHSYKYLCFDNDISNNQGELHRNAILLRELLTTASLKKRLEQLGQPPSLYRKIQSAIQVRLLLRNNFVEQSPKIPNKVIADGYGYSSIDLSAFTNDLSLSDWRREAMKLPLPGDLVVYSQVDLSRIFGNADFNEAVVISRQMVSGNTLQAESRKPEDEYDLILPHKDQINATRTWFDEMWN